MLLVHIEGFLEVARLNSVSRAAESLYVTQPTLTARLHALERELGEQLFVRARHGMRLTEAGRAFMPFAERAVRALREGRRAIDELELLGERGYGRAIGGGHPCAPRPFTGGLETGVGEQREQLGIVVTREHLHRREMVDQLERRIGDLETQALRSPSIDREALLALAHDLPAAWNAPGTDTRHGKPQRQHVSVHAPSPRGARSRR